MASELIYLALVIIAIAGICSLTGCNPTPFPIYYGDWNV